MKLNQGDVQMAVNITKSWEPSTPTFIIMLVVAAVVGFCGPAIVEWLANH